MNNKFSCTLILLASLVISGCASRASSVAPTSVPSANYKGLSCDETKTTLEQKRAVKNALTKQQNNAATGDAVGVFFVLLPLGSVFGEDREGELAQAKGEVMALEGAVSINCSEHTDNSDNTNFNDNDLAEKLLKLKNMKDEGLITEDEYVQKRSEILEDF